MVSMYFMLAVVRPVDITAVCNKRLCWFEKKRKIVYFISNYSLCYDLKSNDVVNAADADSVMNSLIEILI